MKWKRSGMEGLSLDQHMNLPMRLVEELHTCTHVHVHVCHIM